MIRGYQSLEVAHWDEAFDPIRDFEMVENELMLMVSSFPLIFISQS
jgi:ribosome-binding ATPase YchF (GTP1/OBG family)